MSGSARPATDVGPDSDRADERAESDADAEAEQSGSEDADAAAAGIRTVAVRETGRWTGVSALALFAAGAGILADVPGVFLAGAVGVAAAAYARAGDAPDPSLTVERECSDARPEPGDEVEVVVTVRNDGDGIVPDLRLVDGVPPQLHVVDGTPRLGTTLRPGESAQFSYAVEAQRGTHEFEPLRALVRGFSGAIERDALVAADESPTIECTPKSLPPSTELTLQPLTTPYAGRVDTEIGGDGVEFHATREYQRGDPLSRVDWNRRARTGELATTEFREERAASVVVMVDARVPAWHRPDESSISALERSVEAAMQVFSALLDGGDRVGVAALGTTDCWLPPGTGDDHRVRARELFLTHELFTPTSADDLIDRSIRIGRLRERLPRDAQIVLFSPLCDDYVAQQARYLDASGHLVTVISPDPTRRDTPGRTVAAIERDRRQSALRRAGIRVVDWDWDESIVNALARADARWSS